MPTLHIQNYFRSGKTFMELEHEFAIKAKAHNLYPNLYSLKYNMIDSPLAHLLVQECRGIILDASDNWKVVYFPFTKFFNEGEGNAARIDWSTAVCLEKVDGSLMGLYYYDGKWHVASSGTPDAAGGVGDYGLTFAELFWRAFNEQKLPLPNDTDTNYMFELTSPFNRVVVKYPVERVILIGLRNRITYQEIPITNYSGPYPVVTSLPLNNINDVIAAARTLDPFKKEGFVVVDANFNRVKIKSPQYVAIHHMRDGFSMRKIATLVVCGESSEIVAYFPEFAPKFEQVRVAYNKLLSGAESAWNEITMSLGKPDLLDPAAVKRVALKIRTVSPKLHGCLFAMMRRGISAREYFLALTAGKISPVNGELRGGKPRQMLKLLRIKDVEFDY